MDSTVSTPERAKSVKVRYSTRHKREQSTASVTEGSVDGSEMAEHQTAATESPMSAAKRAPKKVDVHLPGPEPSPNNSPSKDQPKKKKSSPTKRDPAYKPSKDGASEHDDASSVGESSTGAPRVRRSEPERIQFFNDDPHCDQIEEHRAHCTSCDRWISLGKKPTYSVHPWQKHIVKCVEKVQVAEEQPEEDEIEEDATSVAPPSVTDRKRTTEFERRAILEADPMVEEARPHEVLCKVCHKWIKLASGRVYVLGNWNRHRESCTGKSQLPSSRVAMAERKLKVVNDPQAKSFTPRSVECAFCSETVAVGKGLPDYDLTKWNEHKMQCLNKQASAVPRVNGTSADTHAVPPASVVTNGLSTTSGKSAKTVSPGKGQKRPRESEDGEAENRPQTRPRTADYEAPQQDPPGPWGWFLMPFKNFFRGFREGLSGGSP